MVPIARARHPAPTPCGIFLVFFYIGPPLLCVPNSGLSSLPPDFKREMEQSLTQQRK
jgi:hypothetical protein